MMRGRTWIVSLALLGVVAACGGGPNQLWGSVGEVYDLGFDRVAGFRVGDFIIVEYYKGSGKVIKLTASLAGITVSPDQLMDLTEAKNTLEEIIKKVNAESKRLFLESYEAIRKEFRELFRQLFGGGDGEVILEDPDDVLDCGIDIVARPPGKELRSISLLRKQT